MQCIYGTSTNSSRKKDNKSPTQDAEEHETPVPDANDVAMDTIHASNGASAADEPANDVIAPDVNGNMDLLYSEMTPGMAPGGGEIPTSTTNTTNTGVPGEQQMFDDNTNQAVSMLLDMQQTPDGSQMMSTQHPVYNTWNPQGLHTDGPAFSFPMNWLPINLNNDLDYDSILGQSLSLMATSTDLDPPSFQPMPAVTLPPNLNLGNTMPLAMDGGGMNGLSNNPFVTSPENRSSEHSSPASQSVRNAPQSASPRRLARGHLYANGANGARVPCTVRDRRDYVQIAGTKPLSPINANSITTESGTISNGALSRLPSLNHISVAHLFPTDAGAGMRISQSTYQQIQQGIQQTYMATGQASLFGGNAIPSLDHLNFFVNLYFQKFNPIVPILHEHHATTLNESWLLALAVSAIGAQYTFTEDFTGLAGLLHDILQRALRVELEAADNNTGFASLALPQALFLSQISLLYHGSSRLFRRAKANHGMLVDMLRSGMLLEPTAGQQQMRDTVVSSSDAVFIEQQWSRWIHDEARLRLGYAIWVSIFRCFCYLYCLFIRLTY